MPCVAVKPELLTWARERLGRDGANLYSKFKKLPLWESEQEKPSLKELESFAAATFVPLGYFFFPSPPEEKLPINDLRTVRGHGVAKPSPNLLDTIFHCQQRQAWYRDYAQALRNEPLAFVGSASLQSSVVSVAKDMRETLGFDIPTRQTYKNDEALRKFIYQVENCGILVMISGVVGINNRRKLDVGEFRGFAISDQYAPLIFINAADSPAAQVFTLAHELAHIWLGDSAISDVSPLSRTSDKTEAWCNRVAAELLVPIDALTPLLPQENPLDCLDKLARKFRVSKLVMLRRIYDSSRIDWETFNSAYQEELRRLASRKKSGGGNFYATQTARVSRRFARALFIDTLEGRTQYQDAHQLLGIKKQSTFEAMGKEFYEIGQQMGLTATIHARSH